MNIKNIAIGGLVVVAFLIGLLLGSRGSQLFGNVTGQIHYQVEQFLVGLKLGDNNASEVAWLKKGTCVLIAPSYSIAASTTVAMDCAVAGAKSGDLVLGMLATSSAATAGPGWEITRASASSTAGFDTFSVTNGTGATAIIPASLASTTQFINIR